MSLMERKAIHAHGDRQSLEPLIRVVAIYFALAEVEPNFGRTRPFVAATFPARERRAACWVAVAEVVTLMNSQGIRGCDNICHTSRPVGAALPRTER
mmetsp:Transcript_17533/g.48416  ORF Transcript_17533/g.48416 Transcript_17533/m.48416 type:complete len:97 (+) Transcript_17533:540-830(+)